VSEAMAQREDCGLDGFSNCLELIGIYVLVAVGRFIRVDVREECDAHRYGALREWVDEADGVDARLAAPLREATPV